MAKQAFVTGSTGFLGRHMIDVLLENGWTVTALCRDTKRARGLKEKGVVLCQGTLASKKQIEEAMPSNVDAVFHMAADTSTWFGDRDRQFATNVDGTMNMINAAKANKAKVFIHTSTTAVYGHHGQPKNEASEQAGAYSNVGYVKSKWLAEQLAKQANADGLPTVIMNPGHILGAYDTHNWARMFFMVARQKLPGVPPGGGCFANGRAVAEAHFAAVDKGKRGENYLLGGPHHSFQELLSIIGEMLNKPIPKKITSRGTLMIMAHIGNILSRFTHNEPRLTPEAASFLCSDDIMDSSKAIKELNYKEVPIKESLQQSLTWLRTHNLIAE